MNGHEGSRGGPADLRERAALVLHGAGPDARAVLLAVHRASSAEDLVGLADAVAAVTRPGDVVVRAEGLGSIPPAVSGVVLVWCDRLEQVEDASAIAARIDAALGGTAQIRVSDPIRSVAQLDTSLASVDPSSPPARGWTDFDEAARAAVAERVRLEADLRDAAEGPDLSLDYQPVVDVDSRRVTGFESLLRWQHEGASVSPERFVPLAERSGAIHRIGAWVLDHAAGQLARWQASGWVDVGVGVNVSARQLEHDGIVDLVADAVSGRGANGVDRPALQPRTLWLELTESVLLSDVDASVRRLSQLADLGVRVLLDDFGTGYSSLTYLRRFPVDAVKLDRSFVSGIDRDPADAAIVGAVVDLASTLGLDCVAEGVERESQLAALAEMGCASAQGELFSAPVPADGAARLLV